MKKMKFHKYILIDEFPHNDDVKLCIFTRPIYPIQHQKRWNKNIKFACSPSAIKSLKRLKIRQAFEIKENNRFLVDGHEIHVNCIEHDGFGSYMLIIQLMGEKEKQILYTGQFTNYRTALINGLSKYVMGNITDIYIDNTLAFSEHTNSLRTACDTVQNYLKKYEGYKVYLDFENLFGYEELLVNLAQRKIKIKLHALQKAVMEYGNNLQHFQFEGEPDLKVFHRPERSNWHLEDYERFFNDDKCVYLKFIATKATTRIESKFKGFHYIVYSPHAPKYTLARLIKLVKPSRIHPLHMPVQIDKVWSNVIPKDIIPISSELKIQTEPELPEIVWNQAIGGVRVNNNTKNGQRGSENLSHPKVQNNQRGQKKGKKERSFLDMSSEEDEYENEHEYDDVSIESINDEETTFHLKKFEKMEKLDDGDCMSMYSESELTDNDSYDESYDESDESDTINAIDECDEVLEDEPKDKVLHDIDPNIFLQQFRAMCQRKKQTWEQCREHNIFEITKTKGGRKQRRKSIIDKSKGTIHEEKMSMGGGSMVPLRRDMKALGIEPVGKCFGTPNKHIHNQSMDWEKSRQHKTKNTTKSADSITQEHNNLSMKEFGQQMRKYVSNDIAELSDNGETQQFVSVSTNKALKANAVNGVAEELFETVTTPTTTTTVKKIRRLSKLLAANAPKNALTFGSDLSSDDSEPVRPKLKGKVIKRYSSDLDECPLTPKKQLTSNRFKVSTMKSSKKACSIVVATPRQSTTISKEIIEKTYLAQRSDKDDFDTSDFRDIRVKRNETVKIILPKTPRTSNTPVKRSKLLAIDHTPHKEAEKKRDILRSILNLPLTKKPILACEF